MTSDSSKEVKCVLISVCAMQTNFLRKAKFDATTGKVVSGPKVPLMYPKIKDEPTYVVKVEGKDILLEPQQSV